MTDLQSILPGFPSNNITTVLERNLITTTDLLVCDAVEIAKRTGLGVLDIRGFVARVRDALKFEVEALDDNDAADSVEVEGESGLRRGVGKKPGNDGIQTQRVIRGERNGRRGLVRTGEELVADWKIISTLDSGIDAALGGGIPVGYITEITGESGAGKTQLLLSLLLTAQLPPPHGLSRPTLYISTESALPTTRLQQILSSNPLLSSHHRNAKTQQQQQHPPAPKNQNKREFQVSLDHIHSIVTPDLESQDHILKFQVPVFVARHNIGLIVLDSVAANYRAEFERGAAGSGAAGNGGANMAKRGGELMKLGELFREIARREGCAVVVANQVGDRFSSPSFNAWRVSASASVGRKRKRVDGDGDGDGDDRGFMAAATQSSPLAYRSVDNDLSTTMGAPTSQRPMSSIAAAEPTSSMLAAAELGLPHPGLPPPPPLPTTSKTHLNTANPITSTPTPNPNPNPNPKQTPPSIPSILANREIMTLDHQQRFFTGWGDDPPYSNAAHYSYSSTSQQKEKAAFGGRQGGALLGDDDDVVREEALKTPSLGLVWSTQIACRVVLKKRPVYGILGGDVRRGGGGGRDGDGDGDVDGVANKTKLLRGGGGASASTEAGTEAEASGNATEEDANPNERILKGWRRWLRLVFAPWVAGAVAGEEVEYEIRREGIRSVSRLGKSGDG